MTFKGPFQPEVFDSMRVPAFACQKNLVVAILPSRPFSFHSTDSVSRSVSSAAQGKESIQFLFLCVLCNRCLEELLVFLAPFNQKQNTIDMYILYSYRGRYFFQAPENVLSLMADDTFTIAKAQYFILKTWRMLFGFYLFSVILRFISGIAVQMNEYLSNVLLRERLTTTLITKRMSNFPQTS